MDIFVSSASRYFTDHQPHGEGLICWEIISRLANRGHNITAVSVKAAIQNQDLPITIYNLDIKSRFSIMMDIEINWKTQQLYKKLNKRQRFDVVHHILPFGSAEAYTITPDNNTPLIIGPTLMPWNHTLQKVSRIKNILRFLPKLWVYRQHKRVTSTSAAFIASLPPQNSYFKNINRYIDVVPYGVDIQQFKPTTEYKHKDIVDILFLARLDKEKGADSLIEAFALVLPEYPAIKLTIVGDGAERSALESLVKQLDLEATVSFWGAVAHHETPAIFQSCDIYCLPSHGEPFGISLLEAMACAKPVVVTSSGSAPYIMVDGKSGLLVEPNDPHALAAALRVLLSSDELRKDMGAFNRKLIEQHYDWEVIIDQIEAIYSRATRL